MKGISTIIAAIMLTVITIGLVATAYLYFSSIVQVGPVITIAAAYCQADDQADQYNISVTLRNDGTASVNADDLTWLVNGKNWNNNMDCSGTLNASGTLTCTIDNLTSSGVYNFVVIGPRNQAGGPVTC